MKKLVIIFILGFITQLQAQVVKTVNLTTPGTLSTSLTADEKNILTSLILTGVIDARDFKIMRDEMPLLAEIDLEGVNIAAYDGSEGTILYANAYPENQVPIHAFYNDSNPFDKSPLTSFIVPVSATSIGGSAFFACEQLSSVDIPSGIESIGKSAFCYCRGLVSLNISEGVSHIGESAFNECTNLASISIPASMRIIDKNAFASCFNLSSLTISYGVINIGESAFQYCKKMSSVVLPSSLTSVSPRTFNNCESLTSVTIPSSVKIIENNAFSFCGQLNTITIPSSVTFIGESAFSNSGINSITIPPSVKTIESYAFSRCWNLSSVEIPEGVTSIGESAFFSCSKLGTVTLPSSVISIGDAAFNNCTNLSSVVISEGVTSIGRSAFISCSRLKSVNIPSSVTTIGMNAFNSCSELASIKAGFSVPLDLIYSIDAFYRVDKATCELQVPYGTKSLYAAAYEWKDFTNIIESPIIFNLSSNRLTIAAGEASNGTVEITSDIAWKAESNEPWLTLSALSGTGNGTLTMTAAANPSLTSRTAQIVVSLEGVTSQTITVLQEAKGLAIQMIEGELSAKLSQEEKLTATKLTLTGNIDARDFRIMRDSMPNLSLIDLSNVHIVAYTGREGTQLYSTVTYPENEIPQWAFHDGYNGLGKPSLTSFIYSTSTATIGKEAFSYCFNLTSAILPSSMNSIGSGAFMYCPKLRTVTIPEGVQSIGASAFENCSYLESVTIPSTVDSIGSTAFDYCERLSSVILTEGVQSIGEYAFSRCMSLSSVIIPSSVLSIGNYAFSGCTRLSSVTLSEGVTSIGQAAFNICTSLNSITIPSSVTSIGGMAFEYCNALTSIKAGPSIPLDLIMSPNVFNGVDKNSCILYVPYESKNLYAQANQWKDFFNISENTVGFKLSANNVILIDTTGNKATLSIKGNIEWTASSNQSWLTVNPDSGEAIDILDIIATDNPSDTNRIARIIVSAVSGDNIITQTIAVTQLPRSPIFEVTPGKLSSLLTFDEKSTITKLILTGTIDARDFKAMRDEMPKLEMIDLSKVQIVAYTGIKGTIVGSTITYPENEIPQWAFYDRTTEIGKASLTSFICPLSTTSIGASAFFYCNNLTSAILPSSLNSIGIDVFRFCLGLRTVTIPEGVQSIGDNAFYNCTNLSAVTIPSSMLSIGGSAFYNCEKLDSLSIAEGIISIGEQAFYNCLSLTSVNIPSSVKSIKYTTFYNCENLISATISEGVQSIGAYSFNDCSNLRSVIIPSTVTSIEEGAFMSCQNLNSISIPEKVQSIGSYAFSFCTSLPSVNIPSSVNSIGNYAFGSCINLISIISGSSIPLDLSNSNGVFESVNKSTCILHVPYGTKNLYAAAYQWKDFLHIEEFEAPIVNPDIIVDKGATDQVIDLKTVYKDAAIISYTVTSNTNEQVVITSIIGSELTFSFSKEGAGTSEITITAISNGIEIRSTFKVEVKIPVGIQPLGENQDMLIYPNPTRGEVHINLTNIPALGMELSVYNVSGKVIYKSLITRMEETIDLQGNPSGVYFIKIGEKVNEIFKIVLQ